MPLPSTPAYGIDTSVLVRLVTGHPEADFTATQEALERLFSEEPRAEVFVSNQVIGEAYIVLQQSYGLTKADCRAGLRQLLQAGIIQPLHGDPVLEILDQPGGAGLIDRLIAQDYGVHACQVLTNDKKMARLEGVRQLY